MSAAALPAGHVLNEYRLDRVLGVGGFGLTYLATDQNLNLPVAIKEYLPSDVAMRQSDYSIRPNTDEDRPTFEWGLTRFLDEARTLATFRHPNIVRVMRFFETYRTAYMVMEFVRGAALSEWVKPRRPLTQAAAMHLIMPLIDGLDTIHRAGYLHRDIKPGNIYIREDGSPVLLDFGAARAQHGNAELTAVVSPGYAPLEQYSESGAQGPWSDIYALGGVMYWMTTGAKPVDATARVRNDPQKPAASVADKALYSPEFLAAIDWALNPDETRRPQSAGQFKAALAGLPIPAPGAFEDRTRTLPLHQMTTEPPSAPIDPALLRDIESQLAQRIGPLASVLVKKAARQAATVEALVDKVALEIEDEDERAAFTRRIKSHSQPLSSSSGNTLLGATKLALSRFDAGVLEKAEKRLAQHIGAVAKVVVKRAAAKARDEGELYLLIADEIEDPADRKAFIKKAISVSGKP